MSVLYIVVPLALLIVGAAVAAFVWSANSGQMDDMETPAVRMLNDETTQSFSGTPALRLKQSGTLSIDELVTHPVTNRYPHELVPAVLTEDI